MADSGALGVDAGVDLGVDPGALRDVAGRCRAVAGAAGLAVDDAAGAVTRTVGCVEWDGPAADVHAAAAARAARRSADVRDCVHRAAAVLDEVASSLARTAVVLAELCAQAVAAGGDPVGSWTLAARRAAVAAEHHAAERVAASALTAAAAALPLDWGEARLAGLTGGQWRDAVRGAGEAAWDAGPGTATFLMRWLPGPWALAPVHARVDAAEDEARAWLVERGGGDDTGGAYWSAYGVGTVGAMLLPGPAGKPGAADDAVRLARAARGGDAGAGPAGPGTAAGHVGEVGAWVGPQGLRLTAAQNREVVAFHAGAAEAERSITPRLLEISERSGVSMAGLEHRLKALESLQRKVADRVQALDGGPDVPRALAGVNDAVRYTVTSDDASFVEDVLVVAHELEQAGFEPVRWHLSWPDDGYQGLNTAWRDPVTRQVFEVQFHTPGSFAMKERTHALYEERRLPGIPLARRDQIAAESAWMHGHVTRPPGVDRLATPPD